MSDRCLRNNVWDRSVYDEYGIPAVLHGGLDRYLKQGIRPGDYLFFMLTNNLTGVMLHWAGGSPNPAYELIRFFCSEIPAAAWGTIQKVEAWIAMLREEETQRLHRRD